MKTYRYRVVEEENGLGHKVYRVQYKVWFGWSTFNNYCMGDSIGYKTYTTENDARAAIELKLQEIKRFTVVRETYIPPEIEARI